MELHTDVFQEKMSVFESETKVKQNILDSLEYMKVHNNVLQDEILKLKSQLEVKQKQLEKSESVKVFTDLQEECSGLKSQLQKQVNCLEEFKVHANILEEEKLKLANQLKIRRKIWKDVEGMKVRTNSLQEENSELISQLEVTQKQLKNSELEKKQYIDKLKDKERCDIAIQTDTVCIVTRNVGSFHEMFRLCN